MMHALATLVMLSFASADGGPPAPLGDGARDALLDPSGDDGRDGPRDAAPSASRDALRPGPAEQPPSLQDGIDADNAMLGGVAAFATIGATSLAVFAANALVGSSALGMASTTSGAITAAFLVAGVTTTLAIVPLVAAVAALVVHALLSDLVTGVAAAAGAFVMGGAGAVLGTIIGTGATLALIALFTLLSPTPLVSSDLVVTSATFVVLSSPLVTLVALALGGFGAVIGATVGGGARLDILLAEE